MNVVVDVALGRKLYIFVTFTYTTWLYKPAVFDADVESGTIILVGGTIVNGGVVTTAIEVAHASNLARMASTTVERSGFSKVKSASASVVS